MVVDNLSSGRAGFVPDGVPFVQGDISTPACSLGTLTEHGCDGVVHVAGFKYAAGVKLLSNRCTPTPRTSPAPAACWPRWRPPGFRRSSSSLSAAVYGTPDGELVNEASPKRPESPYGESKLIGWLINDVARAREGFQG